MTNLPRLIGRLATEKSVLQVESTYETCTLSEKDGIAGASLSYRGETGAFSSTELVAMFLNKLKMITHAETKAPVSDVVISVPSFFTDKERRAMIDAAEIAGLNCLRTVNDVTAAAVNYGLMKAEVLADEPKNVIILDIGYSSLKACLASFAKGQVEIKAHVSDMYLGGRDFDERLVNFFAEHFLKLRKVDVRQNKKALLRLRVACEKMKKVLSGIQLTRMELEALIDGDDFPLEMSRHMFEELSVGLTERIGAHLMELLQKTGFSVDQIDSVEIIGGSTRIPAVKAKIAQLFGKEVKTTLNADESSSRGCALICAMDSPLVRVREYEIIESINFSSHLALFDAKGTAIGKFDLARETPLGQTVNIQLALPEAVSFPIVIEAKYNSDSLPVVEEIPLQFAKFQLSVPASLQLAAGIHSLDLFVRFNWSGLLELEKATVTEQTQAAEDASSASESDESSEAKPSQAIPTSQTLTIKTETFRLPRQVLAKLKDAEIAMNLHDKLVAEIDERRNAVEEYIYEARAKLDDMFASVCDESEREQALRVLSLAEDWLYNDGADLSKEAYIQKLEELKKLMKPFYTRLVEQARAAASPKVEENAHAQKQSFSSPDSSNAP